MDSHIRQPKAFVKQAKQEFEMKRRNWREPFKGRFGFRPRFERLENRLLLASDTEPNNTAALANPFVANESIDGTIGSLTDIDYFKTSLAQGSRLRLYEINFSRPDVLLGLPPSIEVLDESGNVFAASTVGDDLEVTANQQGTYYVRITSESAFGDVADNYGFKTSLVSFSGTTEQEPNGVRTSANALSLNQALRGQLSSTDASDFYSLNLNADDSLFVNFNGIPDQRPGVRLLDASGVVIDSGLAGQGIAYNVSNAGTYFLEVLDNSSAGQTQFYVGVIQVSGKADMPSDAGEELDESSPWVLGRGNSRVRGELSTLNDVDTFAVTINSLARAEITFVVAGSENIPTYGRSMIAYDRQGAIVAKSRDGVLNIERYLGSTPGEYLIQVFADSIVGLGKYGLSAWNFDDFSNQRDVPLHFVDFTGQFPDYWGVSFTAPFAVPAAIPFVTGLVQSRFGAYDVDVTLNKPELPLDRYIRSGFGDFQGLIGGLGGGYYGNRRPNGSSANNHDETSWALQNGSGILIHEFGHAAGLGHARDISSLMAYYHTDDVLSPGTRFGFVHVDQRRPDRWLANDRNRLDWNLNPGSQVLERDSDLNSPQEIDSNFLEMTFELNESPQSLATQQIPSHLASGDFNGDGWKDIVVTHSGTTLSVYMSDSRGGFLSPRDYTVNTMSWWNESATVADFNRDGRDDVAVIGRDQETLTVLIAGADGSLVARPNLSIGRWPQVIQSVDMNADGIVDLVAANASNQVTILLGKGDGTFQTAQPYSSGIDPNHLVLRDFNGDNRVDIATSNYGTDTISIMLAGSSGGYDTVGSFPTGSVARGLTVGDYDGDGDLDLASANHHIRKLTIYENRGNGLFDAGNTYDLGVYTENLTTADMNQDGKLDIIASGNSRSIEMLLGAGNGTFSRGVSFPTPSGSVNSIPLDVNKDGLLDIASISFWENQLYVQTGKSNSLRNDRVVAYGEIISAQDVDVYSLRVIAGAEYSFDIDSAEFQYPLDAELKVLSSTGSVLASNRQAFDRESGIDSLDPYIVTTFNTSDTIRIVVSSENGTAGGYRLKVTPSTALKKDGPHVLAVVPDNRLVIDSTRQISFLMDKPIDPTSIRSDSILVRGAQTGLRAGSAFFDPLDGFLIWTADSTLPVDTYTVTLVSGASGIRDMFGNALDGEIPADFKFPEISGNGTSGGNFVTTLTVDRLDISPPVLYYASYQRDPSNRGRFELRWDDEILFKSVENAPFTLRGAGPDGQFSTSDDRIQSLDAVYNKISNLSYGQGSIDLYTRGYPDSDLYRIESAIVDAAGNAVAISEQVNVGSTVPESVLFVDSSRTRIGLTGSYVNESLRSTTSLADWRTTQSIAGTRVDNQIAFMTDSFGKRADVNLTGGTDDNWDEFSVQWDGWITIPKDGTRLQTRSDDGSRLWVDINKNAQFETSELFDNNWGRGQGITDGALTSDLAAGTYQIRIQYEEGILGNRMNLEWINTDSATIEKGHVNGPSVIGMSIQPGTVYQEIETKKLEVYFSAALDTSTLTSNNFRLRFSTNADFYDGNDTFVSDADGVIQWDPTLHRATFEAATTLKAGYYLVELNGRTGGIRNSAGKLLDGEFVSNVIAGNTNLLSPSRHVSGNGIPGGDYRAGFSIGESISISIPLPIISENGESTTGTVSRYSSTATALVINLSSSDTTAAIVPNSVTIPAGATTAMFTVSAVNDPVADGDQVSVITASAMGHAAVFSNVTVVDDEFATLQLNLSSNSISENAGTATVTVLRNSPTGTALNVVLNSSNTLAAVVPASITIPVGASSATLTVSAVDNSLADGDQLSTITASATGFANGTVPIVVVDDEVPTLSVSLSPLSVSEKNGKSIATVTRNTPATTSMTVNLSSSNPSAGTVPSSVVIPVGASSVTFDATAVDDNIVDGSQVAIISATASGFVSEDAQLTVTDDDIASLSLRITATSISEKNGTTTAVVTRNTSLDLAMLIDLVSSDPLTLLVPKNVTIPIGAESATFELTAVDDEIADGNQRVAITATANGMLSGASDLNIIDDEFATLSLSVDRSSIAERDGQATATVTRNTPMNNALDVNIAAVDASKVQVPGKVTILAGQASVSFGVSSNDNPLVDGDLKVKLIASSLGFATGQATLLILDDDIPRLQITIANAVISEKGGATTGIVTCNTPTTDAMVVSLASSDIGEAVVPETVMILAGASEASFTISAIADSVVDGPQKVQIAASFFSFVAGMAEITILDADFLPTLETIQNPAAIQEDTSTQRVSLAGISAGGGELQQLQVTASSNNTALIPNPTVSYTSPNATGSLRYAPAGNQNGTAVITVTVEDGGFDGKLDTPDDNATFSRSFTVTVNAVNDPPVRLSGTLSPLTVEENTTPMAVPLGLSSFVYGPGGGLDEANQIVTCAVTKIPASMQLFKADGTTAVVINSTLACSELSGLKYKTVAGFRGTDTVGWKSTDTGAPSQSLTESMTVAVIAFNDPPVRTGGKIKSITVKEDKANAKAAALGLSSLKYGPGGGANEASQTLTYRVASIPAGIQVFKKDGVTQVQAGSEVTYEELKGLKYKTVPNAAGVGVLTWTVTDNGPIAKTLTESLTLTITAVNDVPVRTASTPSPISVPEDSATTAVPLGLSGLTYGPGGGAEEAGQTLTYKLKSIPSYIQVFKTNSTTALTAGTALTREELHGLNYRTVPNASGTGNLTWTVTDNGSPALSLTESLTITVTAVNDAPVRTTGTLTPVNVKQDSANTTAVSLNLKGLTYGPGGGADEAKQKLTYKVTNIPDYIALFKSSGAAVAVNTSLAIADLLGLKYKTVAGRTGTGNLTWTVTDNGSPAMTLIEKLPITVGSALLSATTTSQSSSADVLTPAELLPLVNAAISRWGTAGLDPAKVAMLVRVPVTIADLSSQGYLGFASQNQIVIDDNGAGLGWFIDVTPNADEEFASGSSNPASSRMDLLTVVMHEMGHLIGLGDLDAKSLADQLMAETLGVGQRRAPAAYTNARSHSSVDFSSLLTRSRAVDASAWKHRNVQYERYADRVFAEIAPQ